MPFGSFNFNISDTTPSNPFDGVVQRAIPANTTSFMMLYYLPKGESAGHVTTTDKTYYTSWKSEGGEVATLGVLNYSSRTQGRPMAYHYKTHQNGFSLSGNSILNYPTASATNGDDRFIMKEKALPSDSGHTSYEMVENADGEDGVIFQLEQINTNIPEDEIYSGVWYRMAINHNRILPPVFDLPGEVGDHPFPHNTVMEVTRKNESLLSASISPWVLFIPYTTDLSYWSGGQCFGKSVGVDRNTAMLMYNDWILAEFAKRNNGEHTSMFEQKQCFGTLGKNSKFCAFIGKGCNGGLGYNYCKIGETCGKCFGGCKKGACVWDSSSTTSTHFYCAAGDATTSSHTDTGVTTKNKQGIPIHKKSSKLGIIIAVSSLVFLLLILVVYFFVSHKSSGGGGHIKSYNYSRY